MGSSRGRSVSEVVSGQAFADQLQKYKGQPRWCYTAVIQPRGKRRLP